MTGEDLFMQENEQDKYDMYTSFQTAITIRKCKVIQKQEKLILLTNHAKKIKEELKLAKNETKKLLKERGEVIHRKSLRLANIKGIKESRASLEAVISDLNNKVSFEIDEGKKKTDFYSAALQDAYNTWHEYEKVYNEFPMAKERQAVTVELKKIDIDLKKTQMYLSDIKYKLKLQCEIKDKIHHNWGVNLAKLFFTMKEKKSENGALLIQKRELQKKIDDMEAGKFKGASMQKNNVRPMKAQGKEMTQIAKVIQFKVPDFQISPPLSPIMAPTSTGNSLRNWTSLLGSGNLFNILRIGPKKQTLGTAKAVESVAVNKPQTHINKLTVQNDNPNKRQHAEESGQHKALAENQVKHLAQIVKKPMNKIPQKKNNELDIIKTKEYDTNVSAPECKVPKLMDKKNCHENVISKINKENIKINNKYSSLSGIKALMSSLIENNKDKAESSFHREKLVSQNTANTTLNKEQLGTQGKDVESRKEVSKLYMPTPVENHNQYSSHILEATQNYQTIPQHNNQQRNVEEEDLFENDTSKQSSETVMMPMDPNSPPDVIPVESNSQPLSPTMMESSTKGPSQSLSDYMSPSELDEGGKLAFQRIVTESPEFVFPKGTEFTASKATEAEMNEATARSQYFSCMSPPQSLLLNTQNNQEEYQSATYSPDPVYANNGINSIHSPPPGNLGIFGVENRGTSEMLFQKAPNEEANTSTEGGFGFNFGSSRKRSSTFLSLF